MSGYSGPDSWYGAVPCRMGDDRWMPERRWYAFLISSVATPLALTSLVILGRLLIGGSQRATSAKDDHQAVLLTRGKSWTHRATYAAATFTSDQSASGILLKSLGVLCAVGSLIIYWRETAPLCLDVELCHEWTRDIWWQVDLAFNCYFLLYFVLRFLAQEKKLSFVWNVISIVDYFTVPPTFVAIGLDRNWFGLRFLRVLNLLWLVDIARSTGVLANLLAVKFTRLFVNIIAAVIIGAGTFLLLECSGDPWDIDNTLQQNTTFWNFAYFSVVTISTVGYGDMSTKTILGKIFCCLYIFACLFFVASFIATAASLMPPPRRHPKFDRLGYFNHIVLCGDITTSTVQSFFKTFHEAIRSRGLNDIPILILHPTPPDDEMVLLLNKYPTYLEYKTGSPLNEADLQKASIDVASSCIILANHDNTNHVSEDAKSVLQFIAIKNYWPRTPVQVQVLNNGTRIFLNSYPDTKVEKGDLVLCQNDMEAALLGVNGGLISGFSTLMTNLLSPPPFYFKMDPLVPELYKTGSQMRLSSVRFSASFHGMSFLQAARLCYERLNVVLVAIYTKEGPDDSMEYHDVRPNPSHNICITAATMAHIMASSTLRAQSVGIYCRECHGDASANGTSIIAVCHCLDNQRHVAQGKMAYVNNGKMRQDSLEDSIDYHGLHPLSSNGHARSSSAKGGSIPDGLGSFTGSPLFLDEGKKGVMVDQDIQVDSTATFYVCPPRHLDSCTIDVEDAERTEMRDHVVILVTENGLGVEGEEEMANELDKIVYPLRGINNVGHPSNLAPILIVAHKNRVQAVWSHLAILPHITVLAADARKRTVVRAAQVQRCRSCLVISTGACDQSTLGQRVDQNVVMMVLQLRSMTFPLPSPSASDQDGRGKEGWETWYSQGSDIPSVALFENEESLRFISAGAGQNDDYCYSRPFMSGRVLISSHLRSNMLIPACFDPSVLRLLSCLTFGEADQAPIEKVMAEGRGLVLSSATATTPSVRFNRQDHRYSQSLRLMDVAQGPLQSYTGWTYGQVFLTLLQEHGILALGLYRLFVEAQTDGAAPTREDLTDKLSGGSSRLRFVACNPPTQTTLLLSDQVYLLFPATSAQRYLLCKWGHWE